MYRLANGTQVASPPAAPAPVGTPGYGTDGDPGSGQLGSIFGAAEFNRHQEELMAFLLAAGITPDPNLNNQVLECCTKLFGGGGTLAGTGWQKVAGGLILQWGGFSGTTGSLNPEGVAEAPGIAVTFPIAFPTAAFRVVATVKDVVGGILQEQCSTNDLAQTGFGANLSCRQASAAMAGDYFAIGR